MSTPAKYIHVRKPGERGRDWPIATLCGHFAGAMSLSEAHATCPKCVAALVAVPGPKVGDTVVVSGGYALNQARRPIAGRVIDVTYDRLHVAIDPKAEQDIRFCSGNWIPVAALEREPLGDSRD